jgi:hypothetical protein
MPREEVVEVMCNATRRPRLSSPCVPERKPLPRRLSLAYSTIRLAWLPPASPADVKRENGRKGITLNLGDVTIAAVAIHNEVTLLTDNGQGFPYERTFSLFVPQAIAPRCPFYNWSHPHGEEVECAKN